MIKDKQKLIDNIKKLGYKLSPHMKEHYTFKIVINNCKEETFYFVEDKEVAKK